MNFFKSKFFIFCLIAAILLTLVPTLIAAFGGTDLLRSALGSVAKPFTFCASVVANAFNGFIDAFTEYDALKAENAALKAELEEYKNKEYNEELLKEQNAWLKDYINLHDENPDFIFTDALLISREADNTSSLLTFNKGSVHGISVGDPVVTDKGLIGRVVEVGLDWCRALPITDTSSSMGVYTGITGAKAVVKGSATLRDEGLCKMTYISNTDLQMNDRVFTAGGDNSAYPAGLLVGSITDIYTDEATGELTATVTPAVDLTDLGEISGVLIICGYEGQSR